MRDSDSRIEKHSTEGRSAFGCHVGGFEFLGQESLDRNVVVRDFGFSTRISGDIVEEGRMVVETIGRDLFFEENMLRKNWIDVIESIDHQSTKRKNNRN